MFRSLRYAGGTETPATFEINRGSRRQTRPVRGQLREGWLQEKFRYVCSTRQAAVAREGGVFAPDAEPEATWQGCREVGGETAPRACRDAVVARSCWSGCHGDGERVVRRPGMPVPASRPPFVVRSHGAGAPPGRGRRPVEWEAVRERLLELAPLPRARVAVGGLDPRRLRHA